MDGFYRLRPLQRGRQARTDIRHSAGVVLARASGWGWQRLLCGRIIGMDNEDSAGDVSPNLVPPGCRVHWHFNKERHRRRLFRSSVLKPPLPPARRWYRNRSD